MPKALPLSIEGVKPPIGAEDEAAAVGLDGKAV